MATSSNFALANRRAKELESSIPRAVGARYDRASSLRGNVNLIGNSEVE